MLLESLLTGMNATLAGAIVGILAAAKQIPGLMGNKIFQRFLPVIPLLIGVLGGAFGAVAVDPVTMPNKIVAGLMVGGVTMIVFKVTKTSVLGNGLDADAAAVPSSPAVTETKVS